MLTLKSFHLILIGLGIILTAGVGVWGFFNHEAVIGLVSFGVSVLLVVYGAYFGSKAEQMHLE
jgi:hypothetical protein